MSKKIDATKEARAARLGQKNQEVLQQKRKERGLTQEQVRDILGIPERSVQAYEAGVHQAPATRLAQFAELYQCTVEELLDKNFPIK